MTKKDIARKCSVSLGAINKLIKQRTETGTVEKESVKKGRLALEMKLF